MMREQLIRLKDRLNDLSKRNRSIYLTKLYHKWNFDLYQIEQVKGTGAEKLLQQILNQKDTITLLKKSVSNEKSILISKHLNTLDRNMKAIEDETGQYEFFVGYPFVTGNLVDGTFIQGPLFLFPYRLERRNMGTEWILSKEDDPLLNRALVLALRKIGQLAVNESIFEELDVKKQASNLSSLPACLATFGLELSLHDQPLGPFPVYPAAETPTNRALRIERLAVLGNFPQGSSALLKDYDELMKTDQLGLVEELLQQGLEQRDEPDEYDADEEQTPSKSPTEAEQFYLLPTDSSQETILKEARYRKGLVIEGPPGTGKSQVIVNLITDALAQNKKVLVVCQKRAALDVVYQRLETLGLHEHAALVHDEKRDRKPLYGKIAYLLSNTDDSQPRLLSVDFLKSLSKQLQEKEQTLNAIMEGLHTPHASGYTAYQLYSLTKPLDQESKTIEVRDLLDRINRNNIEDILSKVYLYGEYFERFGKADYPLKNRRSFARLEWNDQTKIAETLESTYQKALQAQQQLDALDHERITPEYTWSVGEQLEKVISHLDDSKKNVLQKLQLWWWTSFTGRKIVEELLHGEKFSGLSSPEWENIKRMLRTMYEMGKITDQMREELESLKTYFTDEEIEQLSKELSAGRIPTTELLQRQECIMHDFDELREMDACFEDAPEIVKELIRRAEKKLGFGDGRVSVPEWWVDTIRQCIYIGWIDQIERQYPDLAKVSTHEFERIRESYQQLLTEKQQHMHALLHQQLRQQTLDVLTNHHRSMRELRHQVTKKRKIWPLRKLIHHFAENGLLQVMPVWLTSPEMASAMFPLKESLFDLVIFDEASQCTVENGLPALYRGNQVVIAGDEKQLPPMTLFRGYWSNVEEEDDEEDFEDAQSLLALAKRSFRDYMLQWHYRSKYEELINFSNHAFYHGLMQIAPNVSPDQDPPAIVWHQTNGRWIKQCNEIEAGFVVDLLKKQLQSRPDQSVGIITFNAKQQETIKDLIEDRAEKDPEFAALYHAAMSKDLDQQVFVKNIENVQGDERDVIIFSVGYAPNEEGKIHTRFGTLNQQGRENRLNVAITRAKEQIQVVASIEPHQLNVANATHQGPKLFKLYLEYAKAVSDRNREKVRSIFMELNEQVNLRRKQHHDVFDSPFEQQVCQALREAGYAVDTQVGASGYRIDLAVVHPRHPDRYILGIECDGAMYHSSPQAKERDVYRQRFLEARGWKIMRIWSRNWWKQPMREIEKIDQTIRRMVLEEQKKQTVGTY
jgi:very-short-patch-repair endonuclease